MGKIGTPVVDNNTVALIKFDQNGLVDLCKKVSWTRSGTPKIIDDATMGKIMVGNGCSYTSSSVSFGTNTTMEAWVWIQSNSGRAGYCHMQCDDDHGTNIGTNKNVFHFVIWDADTDFTTTDGWHHVAITLSGKTSSRFVDGKLVETKTSSHNPVGSGILDVAKDCDGVLNDNVSKIAFVRFSSCIRYTTNFDPKAIWIPQDHHTLALLHLDNNLTNSGSKKAVFATDYGSPAFQTTSKFGSASLHFDGKSSIACPYGASGLTLGSQFTIDFWAKYDEWQSYSCLFTIGTTGNTNAICLFSWNSNSTSTEYYFGTYGVAGNSFRQNMDKNWHHFAVVYDNEYYNLYIDGKKKVDKFHYKFNPQSNYKIRFGGSIGGANEFWLKGFMDEIRISDCVRWTADFTPPTAPYESGADPFFLLKSNYGESLHMRKEGKLFNLPTLNLNERETAYNEHKANILVERPDVYSFFPFMEDMNDILFRDWNKVGNVNFMTDSTKKQTDIGYGFVRCDSTTGEAYFRLDEDLGENVALDFWFRFNWPDSTKNHAHILGSGFIGASINGGSSFVTRYVDTTELYGKDNTDMTVSKGVWHHCFCYRVGKKAFYALDGKWGTQECTDYGTKNVAGSRFVQFGCNDSASEKAKDLGQVVDYCNIRVLKTTTPFSVGMTADGFRPPMHPYPYILKGNKIYEHRFVPLMQDLKDHSLGVRIGGGIYSDDPFIDIDNLEPKSKLFHVKNVNGTPKDITGKTTWTVTNVFPTDGYYGASLSTYTSEKYGRIVKSGGPDIIVGQSDFTFLMDFMLTKENTYKNASGTTQKWEYAHFLVNGEANSLQVVVENPGNVYWGPCSTSSGWHVTATGFVKVGRRYRLVIQRKNGIGDVWLNGIRVLKDIVDTNNYSGKDTLICGITGTERMTMLGNFNNCILWNKAIISADSSIEKINGIYCTKKTWRLEAKDALLDGDIEKGATQWQFVLK